jgi:hypothetical protein
MLSTYASLAGEQPRDIREDDGGLSVGSTVGVGLGSSVGSGDGVAVGVRRPLRLPRRPSGRGVVK